MSKKMLNIWKRPHRIARSSTLASQAKNTSSNLVGATSSTFPICSFFAGLPQGGVSMPTKCNQLNQIGRRLKTGSIDCYRHKRRVVIVVDGDDKHCADKECPFSPSYSGALPDRIIATRDTFDRLAVPRDKIVTK